MRGNVKQYDSEREGQIAFFEKFGILHGEERVELARSTDGRYKGTFFEFKLDSKAMSDLNSALSQAIVYLSRERERGLTLPANILCININDEVAYCYKTSDFLEEIEKQYVGGASKSQVDLSKHTIKHVPIDYASRGEGYDTINRILDDKSLVKYHVDRSNILGLSREYYKIDKSDKNKDNFLRGSESEIRKPNILNDRIIPYKKDDNTDFSDIMDSLNSTSLQREIGAFYTPKIYVKEAQKILLNTIEKITKAGKKYVIVDRCAGTGNLEEGLPPDVLENCILSTLEHNEYVILRYKFNGLGAVCVPNINALAFDIIPTEHDALQQVLADNIREKINNPNTVVILYENPPYSDAAGGSVMGTKESKKNLWKQSFVCRKMKEKLKDGNLTSDLGNLFIWSAFEYYLTKPDDYYLLFCYTKYWRYQHIVNPTFVTGFLCNRGLFGEKTTNSAISCILWKNTEDNDTKKITLPIYNVVQNEIKDNGSVTLQKVHKSHRALYDTREFDTDRSGGDVVKNNGMLYNPEVDKQRNEARPKSNDNIIALLASYGYGADAKNITFTRLMTYFGRGFYVRKDNYLTKLPIFVAAIYETQFSEWWHKDAYSKCGESREFEMKENFLRKCLLYTSLSFSNKCRSLYSVNKEHIYKNELCLDGNTLAKNDLKRFELTSDEKYIENKYYALLELIKDKEEYNKDFNYGSWQILDEINVKKVVGLDRNGNKKWGPKYPTINTAINELKGLLKRYYKDEIVSDLFTYELLK
jgi:hypothetical protein